MADIVNVSWVGYNVTVSTISSWKTYFQSSYYSHCSYFYIDLKQVWLIWRTGYMQQNYAMKLQDAMNQTFLMCNVKDLESE